MNYLRWSRTFLVRSVVFRLRTAARVNLTTRMTVRRLTSLTNAHSKKIRNHDAMLGLYFAWYNFCRKHQSIKVTPAQKAGLAGECWTLERLLKEAAIAC